ncbi:NEW3 domain-containing protein [Beutenbergia cavernae]|nr:NEW3 domain-containing protein [Beutenbergia cavernae]
MDNDVTSQVGNAGISRRSVVAMLVGSAVLPPVLGAAPASAAPSGPEPSADGPPADALRRLEKPDLAFREAATITGPRHRVTFHEATWTGGRTYVRDLEVRTDAGWLPVTSVEGRFDEQWVVLTSEEPADAFFYYSSAQPRWVAFDSLHQLDDRTVELRGAHEGEFDLVVRWDLSSGRPELHHVLTAGPARHYIVGYQAVDVAPFDEVEEVLCGALQHARAVGSPAALASWELFAPMALTQRTIAGTTATLGVHVPADVIEYEHERELGPNGQPFGMSLRNDSADVQPVAYAPHAGRRSLLAAGESRGYAFGVVAHAGSLYDAYVDVCREDLGLTAYRQNVRGTSLTQTAHNLLDLVTIDPDADDSEAFVPSFSGWWNRAKGFVDVENDQSVRTAVAGIMLSAQYLLCAPGDGGDVYARRARPMIEYHVSRRNHGTTPIVGHDVYGDASITSWGLGGVSGDASTLVPLYQQTRGQNAGLFELAMGTIANPPFRDTRTPMSTPIQAYRITGDEAWLAEALARARHYARTEIDVPYTRNGPEGSFGFTYSKAWLELFVLHELTGEQDLLEAAHREAKRFVTQTMARKVPGGRIRVPFGDHIDDQFDDWDGHVMPDYPNDDFDDDVVPAWEVSTTGLTFEQLTTYKSKDDLPNPGGGFVMNPIWAPFLLRLAHAVGDSFIADVAHNMVVGRFTSYPGYYYRQFVAWQLEPDFPLVGPPGLTCLYFHHAPAQMGLAIDYLFSEHEVRSDGEISFPRELECDFVYFKYSTYGHAPGRFYGEDGVWPYLPAGSVSVDDPQINWLTGVGNDSLYLSLTNESTTASRVTVSFDAELTGIRRSGRYDVEIVGGDGRRRPVRIRNGRLDVEVPGRGLAAVVIRGAGRPAPWHRLPEAQDRSASSWASDDVDGTQTGIVRGMLLARPDGSGADAYVQSSSTDPATLRYRVDDGAEQVIADKPYPNEWTIPLEGTTAVVRYSVETTAGVSPERTLAFPPLITGVAPDGVGAFGQVEVSPTASPGDTLAVTVRVRSAADEPWEDVALALGVPDGWVPTADPGNPTVLPAGGTVTWAFSVAVPQDAPVATTAITAGLTSGAGDAVIGEASVAVVEPIRILSLTAAPETVSPGDSITLAVHVLNRGPVAQSRTITLAANPGWTLPVTTLAFDLPARGEAEQTITVPSSATIAPGTRSYFSARIGDGVRVQDSVLVVDPNTIQLTNNDFFPRFDRSGTWLVSGLPGPDGLNSLYSPLDVAGGTGTWRPEIAVAGQYEVAIWYPSNAETSRSAVYVVHHADGEEEFVVDQQVAPRAWNVLGTYPFAAGADGFVRIEVRTADGYTRLAGARFRLVG